MFKIKLSILLLISFFVFSCSNNQINNSNQKFSLAYIGGEYDGLLLKNYLIGSLKSLDMYDQNSNFEIQSDISHSTNLYITNIDNTSDREKIDTNLSIKIMNKESNCNVYDDEISVSQFYIYASSDKFLSNQVAVKKIKKDNTESTVRQLINKLKKINGQCNE
tara:strand:+ start:2436 stop:2924 length:489 start_codon:yes stop_codon:yes gene_type:complete